MMRIGHSLFLTTPPHVEVVSLLDDGSGPNDCDMYNAILEACSE